ncbi:MAG: bacterial transcriptional activator domain-containing protein [Acidimicrobiales bacterium]
MRRILGGGVIADRDSVRIDLSEVRLDLADLLAAVEADDCPRVVELYTGEYLPLDLYEDWAAQTREYARAAFTRAAGQLAITATTAGDHDQAAALARRILSTDQFDEEAHRLLITALLAAGHTGAARQAHAFYVRRMDDLGVTPVPFDQVVEPAG